MTNSVLHNIHACIYPLCQLLYSQQGHSNLLAWVSCYASISVNFTAHANCNEHLLSQDFLLRVGGKIYLEEAGVGHGKSSVSTTAIRNLVSSTLSKVRWQLGTTVDELEILLFVFFFHLVKYFPEPCHRVCWE